MGFANRLRAVLVVVAKRMRSQPWLLVATVAGLIIAIALMMSIPLYADAVYYRVFLDNIRTEDTAPGEVPPFNFLFRYDGSIYGTQDWEQMLPVDNYLTHEAAATFGLPEKLAVRYFTTDPFGIYTSGETAFSDTTTPLVWAGFTFLSELQDHIVLTEGVFPSVVAPDSLSALEVMVHEELATKLGLQLDEVYTAYIKIRSEDGFTQAIQIPIRITGVWRPSDRYDPYWFFNPSSFVERLMVPEESFSGYLRQAIPNEVYTAAWYLVLDGSEIHHTDAAPLIRRAQQVTQRAAGLMPNTKLGRSPIDALYDYRRSTNLLTILLYAFSIPIFALLLTFIALTSDLAVERRRNEVAVLRSRGAMTGQMIGIAALESLLLGLAAMAISAPLGMAVAGLMGQTRSFLDFSSNAESLRVDLTATALRFGLGAVALAVFTQVVPTIGAAAHTVVSYKREQARMMRKPWWQRIGLDFILLVPAAYGAYLLRQQGSVIVLEDSLGNSPFQNPLLFLVPALGIFALTLLFLRIMPLMMSAVAWIAARTRAVGLLMAARHLARTPSFYATPLILLVLTLSLSAFTASLANTLDAHLYDMMYYRSGADFQFLEMGEDTQQSSSMAAMMGGGASGEESEEEAAGPRWLFYPVSDYLNVPGVESAMRVARYAAVTRFLGGQQTGVFYGIERASFPQIAYWRDDFADSSLGILMNALAMERRGVLVPADFMKQNVLNIGDEIQVVVTTYGQNNVINMKIVGTFTYFPGWYPSEGPLFVGDLDYLFEQAGGQFPYGVWLSTTDDADLNKLANEELTVLQARWSAPGLAIRAEQQLPERQGLFGLLSIGFSAAAVLTVLGFLLYALFSFRRRFIEFGVLRAVGLSANQMSAFLGWELALLIVMGGALGTLLGRWVSTFFIPFLQIGVDEMSRIPPYVVDIAWSQIFQIYALFGALFVVAFVALVVMLRRMRIFEAVKLGETA